MRPHEVAGLENGPVDVGLRGKMDDSIPVLRDAVHELSIANVALDKREVPVVLVVLQVVRVSGVCELVDDDDVVPAGGQPAAYKTASDEAHTARDDEACHEVSLHLDVPIVRNVLRVVGDAELIRRSVVIELRRKVHEV